MDIKLNIRRNLRIYVREITDIHRYGNACRIILEIRFNDVWETSISDNDNDNDNDEYMVPLSTQLAPNLSSCFTQICALPRKRA